MKQAVLDFCISNSRTSMNKRLTLKTMLSPNQFVTPTRKSSSFHVVSRDLDKPRDNPRAEEVVLRVMGTL
jgi:hypothetical protein